MSEPVELIIVGAGDRGTIYSRYAILHPDRARIVGVAEPRDYFRQRMAETHQIPPENVSSTWQELVAQDKFADAVVIATRDTMHVDPAVALAHKGYHMLLEKPMATTEEDCRKIVRAATDNDIIFAVCHVMRYTNYTQKLKALVDSGLIGEVVNIQHLEPVGYWHYAHSYVRGNWRKEADATSILLAKSCHDLDWLRYMMGTRCLQVSSFGSLYHFKKENKPPTAGVCCLDCDYAPKCPYSAKAIYPAIEKHAYYRTWLANVLTPDLSPEGITKALRTGPYGRCVYEGDNDVMDNQVVNMLFEGGKTATFTLTAFTPFEGRHTRLFGTLGQLSGDGSKIEHYDFLTEALHVIETPGANETIMSGHGGGDYSLMAGFVSAVAANAPGPILSGPDESLETHLMVFAAEEARRKGCVMDVRAV